MIEIRYEVTEGIPGSLPRLVYRETRPNGAWSDWKIAEVALAPTVKRRKAYMCPACNGLWRENEDSTVSLLNGAQKSCNVCEQLWARTMIEVEIREQQAPSAQPAQEQFSAGRCRVQLMQNGVAWPDMICERCGLGPCAKDKK